MVASPGGVCAAANAERQLKDMYSIVASNLHISTGDAKQVVNETLGSTDENNFIADNLKTDTIIGASEDTFQHMSGPNGVGLGNAAEATQSVQKNQESQGGGIGEFFGNLFKGFQQQSTSGEVGDAQGQMNFGSGMVQGANSANGNHSQNNGMMNGNQQDSDSYVNILMKETGMNEEQAIAELKAMCGNPFES